jgi:ferredoxin
MYKITRDRLPALLDCIAEKMPLYLPMRGESGVNFSLWQGDFEKVDLHTLKTVLSPKGFFLPAIEELYSTVQKDNNYEIIPQPTETQPFVLFGVRACDAAAISILDSVFLGEPTDEFYQARRQGACIITLACDKPGATCFCGDFGINPAEPGGDVAVWLTNDFLYWLPQTDKGEQLTEAIREVLREVFQSKETAPLQPLKAFFKIINQKIPLPTVSNHKDMLAVFNAPVWDDLHQTCIACGTCTFLCPTCQCYDIANHETGETIHCRRHWDACLYPGFTQMAHGNPRPTKKERFRQRYMHKLVYHPQKYGVFGCVGCGRCVDKCPVNMNIVKVARAL